MVKVRFQDWAQARTAYEALLISDRRAIHRHAAEAIESAAARGSEAPDDDGIRALLVSERSAPKPFVEASADLSRHWHGAGQIRRAGLVHLIAAREAAAGGRNDEATARATQAAAWLAEGQDPVGAAAAALDVGRLLIRAARFGEALARLRTAGDDLAVVDAPGSTLIRIRLVSSRAAALESTGKYAEALDLLQGALAGARKAGSAPDVANCLRSIGALQMVTGEYDKALLFYKEALDSYRQAGDQRGTAAAIQSIGSIHWQKGRLDEAFAAYKTSIDIHRTIAHYQGIAAGLNNLGAWYWSKGDFEAATKCHEQALALRRRAGERAQEAASLNNLGIIHDARGAHAEAIACFEESRAIRKEIRDRRGIAVTTANIAWSLLVSGNAAGAAPEADRATEAAEELQIKDLISETLATRAIARFRVGKRAESEQDARRAIALADATTNAVERVWGRVALALVTGAQAPAAEALEMARALENPIYLCEALLCVAEVALRGGRGGPAVAAIAETVKIAKKVGALGMLRRAEALAGRKL